VEKWRDEGHQHEQKASAMRAAGHPANANRRQAEAGQCFVKADELFAALVGAQTRQETT
jgi:hypothetical protein